MKVYNMAMVENSKLVIYLYDQIGSDGFEAGTTAKDFAVDLKSYPNATEIEIRINSPGGSITEGLAMYNLLKAEQKKKVCYIDGIAASMASVIAMAGDEIIMPENSVMMIHNPWTITMGDSEQLRKDAALLDMWKQQLVGIYVGKSGKSSEEVISMMDAETWLDASQAKALGFATSITEPILAAASAFKSDVKLNEQASKLLENYKRMGEIKMEEVKVEEVKVEEVAPVIEPEPTPEEVKPDEPETVEEPIEEPVDDKALIEKLEQGLVELSERNEELATKVAELEAFKSACKCVELTAKVAELEAKIGEADKTNSANVETINQLSQIVDANKVTIDGLNKQLVNINNRHNKLISAGIKFKAEQHPEPVKELTWAEALKICNGDYTVARTKYNASWKKFMGYK